MLIKTFGKITDVIATDLSLEKSFATVADLKVYLHNTYPLLAGITYLIIVNKHKVEEHTILQNTDEIALLPPFSGG